MYIAFFFKPVYDKLIIWNYFRELVLQEAGYYSESLLNFITQVGGGFTENTDGKTVQEMIDLVRS